MQSNSQKNIYHIYNLENGEKNTTQIYLKKVICKLMENYQNERSDINLRNLLDQVKNYSSLKQEAVDNRAYWVDQREVGYLTEDEINKGNVRIGTNNIQQCVAVIIDGCDKEGKRLVALAHVDINTTQDSLIGVLKEFDKTKPQSIILHGARNSTIQAVSNFRLVAESLIEVYGEDKLRSLKNYTPFEYGKNRRKDYGNILPINGLQAGELLIESALKIKKQLDNEEEYSNFINGLIYEDFNGHKPQISSSSYSYEEDDIISNAISENMIYDSGKKTITQNFPKKGYNYNRAMRRKLEDNRFKVDPSGRKRTSDLKEIRLNEENIKTTESLKYLSNEYTDLELAKFYEEDVYQKKLDELDTAFNLYQYSKLYQEDVDGKDFDKFLDSCEDFEIVRNHYNQYDKIINKVRLQKREKEKLNKEKKDKIHKLITKNFQREEPLNNLQSDTTNFNKLRNLLDQVKNYSSLKQEAVDNRAYWVDQREVGYLTEDEINKGNVRIGTNNIQQCVAVIIDGGDKEGKRLVALAHVDKNTTKKSLEKVFEKFGVEENTTLKIKLYGAIDLSDFKDYKVGEENSAPYYTTSASNFMLVISVINSSFKGKDTEYISFENYTPFEISKYDDLGHDLDSDDDLSDYKNLRIFGQDSGKRLISSKSREIQWTDIWDNDNIQEAISKDIIYSIRTERFIKGAPHKGYSNTLNLRTMRRELEDNKHNIEGFSAKDRTSDLKEIILNEKNITTTKFQKDFDSDYKASELLKYYQDNYNKQVSNIQSICNMINGSSQTEDIEGEVNSLEERRQFFQITKIIGSKLKEMGMDVNESEFSNKQILRKVKQSEKKIARGKFSGMELKRQTRSQSASKSKYEF